MGVSIGRASWPYIGFGVFRRELATLEGFDLDEMRGYGGKREWDTVTTPLVPLLNHADNEGSLSPQECAQVYPRLEELIPQLHDSYDREHTAYLVASMKQAVEEDYRLEFC